MASEHSTQSCGQLPTEGEVTVSIEDGETSKQERPRSEPSAGANLGQQPRDTAQADQIMNHQLYSAAKRVHFHRFSALLTENRVLLPVVLRQRSPSGNTLLHAAAENEDIIRAIIGSVPADLISQANSSGETPLHIAARAGKAGAVEKLLLHGSNPGARDKSGNSALHEAVRNRHCEVIRQLVSEDPNPLYHCNNERKSPWCVAVETRDLEVLGLLLEAPNPVETAELDPEILNILPEGPNPVITGNSDPVLAAENSYPVRASNRIIVSVPVYPSNPDAAERWDPEAAEDTEEAAAEDTEEETLQEKIRRVFGMSPAHVAVLYRNVGDTEGTEEETLQGKIRRVFSMSPAHVAVLYQNMGETEEDAEEDAEDTEDTEEETLQEKNRRDFGMSPAHVAVLYRNKDMLIEMSEKKPGLFRLRDVKDGNPLHFAAYTNYLDGVKFLIEKFPLSALDKDKDGYLPIHVASMMDHVRIIEELLRQWPDDPTEFRAEGGETILHVSARYGSISTVKYILKSPELGHLINARDFNLNTPLHLAALYYQPSVLLPLARDGRADLKLVNNRNMTALDVVEEKLKTMDAPLRKRLTRTILRSAGVPRSEELAICDEFYRNPRIEMQPPEWEKLNEVANTRMIVATVVATMTFASGFSIPGGYNSSNSGAGIAVLLHKPMYNVFVICNSIAVYSSIITIVILLWTQINDPYTMQSALRISRLPLLVTLATMPVAFMAGVFVSVTKLAWLSIFVLVLGSVALFIILSFYLLMYIPLGCKHHLIRRFTDLIILAGISISGSGIVESGFAVLSQAIEVTK